MGTGTPFPIGSMYVYIYISIWYHLPSIYPSHLSIYTSTMGIRHGLWTPPWIAQGTEILCRPTQTELSPLHEMRCVSASLGICEIRCSRPWRSDGGSGSSHGSSHETKGGDFTRIYPWDMGCSDRISDGSDTFWSHNTSNTTNFMGNQSIMVFFP